MISCFDVFGTSSIHDPRPGENPEGIEEFKRARVRLLVGFQAEQKPGVKQDFLSLARSWMMWWSQAPQCRNEAEWNQSKEELQAPIHLLGFISFFPLHLFLLFFLPSSYIFLFFLASLLDRLDMVFVGVAGYLACYFRYPGAVRRVLGQVVAAVAFN